ncbi:conserved protein of unknown function [Ectopseudomonas oleovorans]|uniref:Uncharacterized protein n=1 Tax=Ectopseudomonas oleovorans TaxID=301 RepID=A0A653B4I7_ECTOL|nr:conserved protein of unknown function [Pseudomonas oleovorans]
MPATPAAHRPPIAASGWPRRRRTSDRRWPARIPPRRAAPATAAGRRGSASVPARQRCTAAATPAGAAHRRCAWPPAGPAAQPCPGRGSRLRRYPPGSTRVSSTFLASSRQGACRDAAQSGHNSAFVGAPCKRAQESVHDLHASAAGGFPSLALLQWIVDSLEEGIRSDQPSPPSCPRNCKQRVRCTCATGQPGRP